MFLSVNTTGKDLQDNFIQSEVVNLEMPLHIWQGAGLFAFILESGGTINGSFA